MPYRIGHGYDVHRLTENRRLVLGGVEIPCEQGLLGHSDADCLLHAIMDAVLGALGLGDIGRHFPDSDPALLGIDSCLLAARVADMMHKAGYAVGNIDATVIAEWPRLARHIPAMCRRIAEVFGCDASSVNVKATTEEGLGFTGRDGGIAAHAVCLLCKK